MKGWSETQFHRTRGGWVKGNPFSGKNAKQRASLRGVFGMHFWNRRTEFDRILNVAGFYI